MMAENGDREHGKSMFYRKYGKRGGENPAMRG
jgi:hypothetical protein